MGPLLAAAPVGDEDQAFSASIAARARDRSALDHQRDLLSCG